MDGFDKANFKLICQTNNEVDVAFFKSAFEAEDIIYYVIGDSPSRRYNTIPMQIFVQSHDIDRAKEIIKSVEMPAPSSEEIKSNYRLPSIMLLIAIGVSGIVFFLIIYKMRQGW